ncbi:hypothetical protein BD410DRAFT_781588 [Rickenella mellea]|uniref:DUF7587 domain-containing protein n=1 Tax=Rickenella mellea TaxID=50990 RepID=A0A4Y7QKV7_9AGAM|nr:hypothetical protein BD410DRAFT_781588 [Rickenella mellea]
MPVHTESTSQEPEGSALPQYGFGSDFTFDKLIEQNRFLFRVYTPRARSSSDDSSDAHFLGGKFKRDSRSSTHLSVRTDKCEAPEMMESPSFEDVAQHMDWTTRSLSPFVTTSFSFAWAVWEAVRRYRLNVKLDVEIAVIDARMVADRAVTALELLRKATAKQRDKEYWKWYRFALESQDVLVFRAIPGEAIFASIPLKNVLNKLPSYFLADPTSIRLKDDPFDEHIIKRVGWDVNAKSSHRQFCHTLSARFLRLSPDDRLRESTRGAVSLAVCLLHPWFRAKCHTDPRGAVELVTMLARAIARWPAAWWARQHPELPDMIDKLVDDARLDTVDGDRKQMVQEIQRLRSANISPADDNRTTTSQTTTSREDVFSSSDDSDLDSETEVDTEAEEESAPKCAISRSVSRLLEVQSENRSLVSLLPPISPVKSSGKEMVAEVSVQEEREERIDRISDLETLEFMSMAETDDEWDMARLSSWALSTFLSGVLVALFVASSQRRDLANMLT